MQGSEAMAHDSGSLATPDIKWIGVRPSDLDKYRIPAQCRLDLTDSDVKFAQSLLEKEYIRNRGPWVKVLMCIASKFSRQELQLLLAKREKAEIRSPPPPPVRLTPDPPSQRL
jgi:meiotic recombination protein SPO11